MEEWRPVVRYEGLYEVSSLGRVRSLDRYESITTKDGRSYIRESKGRLLAGEFTNGRVHYRAVNLYPQRKRRLIHRLVAEAFLGPCPDGYDVRHLDKNHLNNAVDNLAYGTRQENMADSIRDERQCHKLSPTDVREIRKRIKDGDTNTSICADYGVSDVAISYIRLGKSHRLVV